MLREFQGLACLSPLQHTSEVPAKGSTQAAASEIQLFRGKSVVHSRVRRDLS